MAADTDGIHSSVKAIQDMEAACARFSRALVERLPEIERELRQTTEALEERRSDLRREVASLQHRISSADEDDDVSWESHRVEEADDELASVQRHIRSLAEVSAAYTEQARKAEHLANSHSIQAREFLNGAAEDLKAYLAVTGDGSQASEPAINPISVFQPIPDLIGVGSTWKTLPSGIHTATLEQVETRFATNEKRKLIFEGFKKGVAELQIAGCKKIFLDGSFVSDKPEPGDFDACWEPIGINYSKLNPLFRDFEDSRKRQKEAFRGEFFPTNFLGDEEKDILEFFQIDRYGNRKGILQIQS